MKARNQPGALKGGSAQRRMPRAALPQRGFLLDLDDTLFDHRYAVRASLLQMTRKLPEMRRVAADELENRWMELLDAWHPRVQRGEVSPETSGLRRTRALVEGFGVRIDERQNRELRENYLANYQRARRPVPGAVPLLRSLHRTGPVGIITNNFRDEQEEKIAAMGVGRWIDLLVTSEEVGSMKPDPRIFQVALERLGLSPGQATVLGDSWDADVRGGLRAGLKVVWFNPRRLPQPPGFSVPELHALRPLPAVLKVLEGPAGSENRTVLPPERAGGRT